MFSLIIGYIKIKDVEIDKNKPCCISTAGDGELDDVPQRALLAGQWDVDDPDTNARLLAGG